MCRHQANIFIRFLLLLASTAIVIYLYQDYRANNPFCLWNDMYLTSNLDNSNISEKKLCSHSDCNKLMCQMINKPGILSVTFQYQMPNSHTKIPVFIFKDILWVLLLVMLVVTDFIYLYKSIKSFKHQVDRNFIYEDI